MREVQGAGIHSESVCLTAKRAMTANPTAPTSPQPPAGQSFAASPCSAFPPVLDACCSTRGFWFDKQDNRALFMDRRKEECRIKPDAGHPARNLIVSPDIVADFTDMPFPDETFWHVVWDPPHARFGETSVMAKTYGTLMGTDWREMIRGGFSECWRVLVPGGTLIFKWCEWEIPLREVLAQIPERPLYGHISGKRAQTHWVAFLKPNTPAHPPQAG